MPKKIVDFSRREFLKAAGAAGIGSILSPVEKLTHARSLTAASDSQQIIVPKRPFGKTGVDVSILSLGGAFDKSNQLLLKQALNMGISYWDTAYMYKGGNSERGIGKYFLKYPEDRKKVFLVTKSYYRVPNSVARQLKKSLDRLNTDYIDLFSIHAIADVNELEPFEKIKAWTEKTRAEGKIRYFGFSTHKNMEDNLLAASKLGWIDGIMFSYNFRIMHNDKMRKAVDECTKAGIGLTAMKTQASGWLGWTDKITPNEKEQKLFNQLKRGGLTIEQAKLKAVWDDSRIASICSHMPNMTILAANATAAMDKTELSSKDKNLLNQYAFETGSNYCAGCASICESEIDKEVPISDVMRCLMYSRGYGDHERAKSVFKKLPSNVRKLMGNIDYNKAERKCPQGMQIGRLMRKAVIELS
jgi:predicted aldo/keto reductase-like oxidoreductase